MLHLEGHEVLTVVSPSFFGEVKDQDRARWFPEVQVACVCDGTTSSPYSAQAAKLAVQLSPMLFGGNVEERFKALAEVLIVHRLRSQRAPVRIAANRPAAMGALLKGAFRKKLQSAFQTTLVAMQLTVNGDNINITVVWCGDSAFFGFAPTGELLLSTLDYTEPGNGEGNNLLYFGPGDELLVKVLGNLSEYGQLAGEARLQSLDRWLVCLPLDPCNQEHADRSTHDALCVRNTDKLLVPRYLIGSVGALPSERYRQVRYSRLIRIASPNQAETPRGFSTGTFTPVLPDHVHSGQWRSFLETVPADTHFVLASDGFHGSFGDAAEMQAWLFSHKEALREPTMRREVTRELHTRLHTKSGDDDISFVWVSPREVQHGC